MYQWIYEHEDQMWIYVTSEGATFIKLDFKAQTYYEWTDDISGHSEHKWEGSIWHLPFHLQSPAWYS